MSINISYFEMRMMLAVNKWRTGAGGRGEDPIRIAADNTNFSRAAEPRTLEWQVSESLSEKLTSERASAAFNF